MPLRQLLTGIALVVIVLGTLLVARGCPSDAPQVTY